MAVDLSILPARLEDAQEFVRMRPAEVAEVLAASGWEPVEAVIQSISVSDEAWTARFNGEVACIFGISEHPFDSALTPMASIWMLTTTTVDKYPVTFYRYTRLLVKDLCKRHGILANFMDARYSQAVNWAKRIGFDVHPPLKLGRNGELFHPIFYGV